MKNRIRKFRRDRWRDRVLSLGKKIDRLYRYRSSLSVAENPYLDYEVELTDHQLDRLERKRDSYLAKIRDTA